MAESELAWSGAILVAGLIFVAYAASFHRRNRADEARHAEAVRLGIDRPGAQFPRIDPERCIGCGACVGACPEGDVLGLVGGLAVVINGLACVGLADCEKACAVGAISVGLGDPGERADLPLLDGDRQTSVPGVYVAGELGGLSLVRNAVEQGRQTLEAVARRLGGAAAAPDLVDVAIVGAGPAGLSAALAAAQRGLSFRVLEQEDDLGGTILKYPRRKLVLLQPLDLPLHGRIRRREIEKEELLELVTGLVERHRIDIRFGERVVGVERTGGLFSLETTAGSHRSRFVILALGRRGTPRRLGVPGESLPKVLYQVRDAAAYRRQRILCVGGGDSAVEAALGLSRQPGTEVTLAYRRERFFRLKKTNRERLDEEVRRGRVRLLMRSRVLRIEPEVVILEVAGEWLQLANDVVFALLGGIPPYPLLRQIGVRFGGDPEPPQPLGRSPR